MSGVDEEILKERKEIRIVMFQWERNTRDIENKLLPILRKMLLMVEEVKM